MADAKHTPGPWKAHPMEKAHGLPYAPVAAETLLAKVYSKHFGDDVQAEANARLIAAAPDLLEALQAIFAAMHPDIPGAPDSALEKARAAIAKATGSAA